MNSDKKGAPTFLSACRPFFFLDADTNVGIGAPQPVGVTEGGGSENFEGGGKRSATPL